jgi:DNA-binding MarR family transcriptional regulator
VAIDLRALELWRNALTASVRADTPDLSARQMALLLNVYLTDGPHTVRGLAADLKVSKPAISRALDRLGELGYVRRKRDEMDRRNVLVQRTVAGSVFLVEFAGMINTAQAQLAAMPNMPFMITVDEDVADAGKVAPAGVATTDAPQANSWIDAAE